MQAEVYTNEGRASYVGYWFDRLARHLLGAKQLSFEDWNAGRSNDENGFDIDCHDLRACVEVKGCSNMDQMKLFDDQLDSHLAEFGFPFDHGFFWIFRYRNYQKRNGKRSRLLKNNRKSVEEAQKFLAENTNVAFAVDIHLLNLLRKQNGTSEYSRDMFRDRQIVSINPTKLRDIALNMRSSLVSLGLSDDLSLWLPPKAKRTQSRIIETEMDGNAVKFELVLLLQNSLKTRLLKLMNGIVKKI